jgi:putative MFS transporter
MLAVLILPLFRFLRNATGDYITGGWLTAIILMAITIVAMYVTKETFGKDLNYVEQ